MTARMSKMYLRCLACGHRQVIELLPMSFDRFIQVLRDLHCFGCGLGADKLVAERSVVRTKRAPDSRRRPG